MNIWSDTMNEIIDKIVGNNVIFGGILIFLGIILIVLIASVVRGSKKTKKIPIYEEDLEDKELEKVKEKNIIDKPEVKKKKKKTVVKEEKQEEEESLEPVEEAKEVVEEDDIVEDIPEEEEESFEEEPLEEKEGDLDQQSLETIYSEGEPEEVIDEGYSEERIAELENIDEEEIKARIDKEHEEDIEETMEEIENDEMNDILKDLKEAKELKPEDVVRQFEQEQEAQSIISYQELVDVVKNRDKDFEDELESKPLATVSDFLPEVPKEEKSSDMSKLIEELAQPRKIEEGFDDEEFEAVEELQENIESEEDIDVESTKAMVREALKEIPEDGKFKRTELISPVFGRIAEETEDSYPTVKKFTRDSEENPIEELEAEEIDDTIEELESNDSETELIEELQLKEAEKDDTIVTEATDIESIEDISEELEEEQPQALFEEIPNDLEETKELGMGDISKNEEFLKALKDFRDSL